MGETVLIIGVIVLAVGIILGIITKNPGRRGFAIWLTIIGVGFIIAGFVLGGSFGIKW